MKVLRVLAGAFTAVLVLAATAGAVVLAEQYPPGAATSIAGEATAVDAGPSSLTCAGPVELTTGEQIIIDPEEEIDPELLVPASATNLLTLPREPGAEGAGAPAEAQYHTGGAEPQNLTASADIRVLQLEDPESAGIFEAQPVEGEAALMGGVSLSRTEAGELRGLAGSSCQGPQPASYLVGGSGDVGSSTRLTLTNTGATPATATVTLWSSLGPVSAPQLEDIALAPGAHEHLLLESVSGDPALALRVESPAGQVSAHAQELRLDGVVPAGADLIGTAAAPSPEFVIPGVLLPASAEAEDRLRLLNPGESEVQATVHLLGENGPVDLPGAENVTVDPGAVLELSLAGVEAGAYAVHVVADQPLTGAVQLTRTGEAGPLDPATAPVDRAWAPAVPPSSAALLTLPELAEAAVLLSNRSEDPAEITLTPIGEDGSVEAAESLEIPPLSTVVVEPDAQALRLRTESEAAVSAAAVLSAEAADGELITVITPVPDAAEALAVRVGLR